MAKRRFVGYLFAGLAGLVLLGACSAPVPSATAPAATAAPPSPTAGPVPTTALAASVFTWSVEILQNN